MNLKETSKIDSNFQRVKNGTTTKKTREVYIYSRDGNFVDKLYTRICSALPLGVMIKHPIFACNSEERSLKYLKSNYIRREWRERTPLATSDYFKFADMTLICKEGKIRETLLIKTKILIIYVSWKDWSFFIKHLGSN